MRPLVVAVAAVALALAVPVARADAPPPSIASSLAEGQTLSGKVAWQALGSGAPLDHVEFVVDGWLRDVERAGPFTYAWDTTREANGPHTLDLWAVYADGSVATAEVHVVVQNSFSLGFADLHDGDTVSGTVPWHAELDGIAPEWVEFHVDGALAFTESAPPYGRAWDTTTLANGPHTLELWAVATNGRVATAEIQVVVRNAGPDESVPARVAALRAETWGLQSLMRVPRSPAFAPLAWWQRKAAQVRLQASRPPHWQQFLCIHRYEGAWDANTGNGYFGGLQMNREFIASYGPELLRAKGLAYDWTPLEQIWVAERAWKVRGFTPWPQTARMCALLPSA